MIELLFTLGLFGYMGPGAGLGLMGALIGLVVALGSALGFVLMYPLRALFRKRDRDASN